MKTKQITTRDLVKDVTGRGYRRIAAEEIVTLLFDRIMEHVANGYKVRISGFGLFEPRRRAARTARNPRTNEAVLVPERTIPIFTPAKDFKDKMGGTNGE